MMHSDKEIFTETLKVFRALTCNHVCFGNCYQMLGNISSCKNTFASSPEVKTSNYKSIEIRLRQLIKTDYTQIYNRKKTLNKSCTGCSTKSFPTQHKLFPFFLKVPFQQISCTESLTKSAATQWYRLFYLQSLHGYMMQQKLVTWH